MKTLKKSKGTLLYSAGVILFIWELVSYIDIIMHNTSANPQYLPFNLLTMFLGV